MAVCSYTTVLRQQDSGSQAADFSATPGLVVVKYRQTLALLGDDMSQADDLWREANATPLHQSSSMADLHHLTWMTAAVAIRMPLLQRRGELHIFG